MMQGAAARPGRRPPRPLLWKQQKAAAAAAAKHQHQETPSCMSNAVSSLGWQGRFRYDSPEVATLRLRLEQHAGIPGMEGLIVDPMTDPDGFAERAAAQFHRDGFVVVAHCLDAARLATIRHGCDAVIRKMVALDPLSAGSRGTHRYTFGAAPSHFGYESEWAVLIDPPNTLAVLQAIFGSANFYAASSTAGGDFVLPGCVEYQHLHSDGQMNPQTGEHARDWRDAPNYGGFTDPTGRLHYRDLPTPQVTVNYPMELLQHSPIAHSRINGATR
jgi:hypothetical protein